MPGPPGWHDLFWPFLLVKEELKQLGAPESGPAPVPVVLWQIPQAAVMLPAV
jgi:hypothetical protein